MSKKENEALNELQSLLAPQMRDYQFLDEIVEDVGNAFRKYKGFEFGKF